MDSSIEWFPNGSKGPNRTWPAFRHDLYDDTGNSWPTQLGGKSNLPSTSSMIIYAINYNVLRIMSGMVGSRILTNRYLNILFLYSFI